MLENTTPISKPSDYKTVFVEEKYSFFIIISYLYIINKKRNTPKGVSFLFKRMSLKLTQNSAIN